MHRFVAFPSAFKRYPVWINDIIGEERDNMRILHGPTESGLYLLEATESAINVLIKIYGDWYVFILDFEKEKNNYNV